MSLNMREVEADIDAYVSSAEHDFELADVCRAVSGTDAMSEEQQARLEKTVMNILIDSPEILFNPESRKYIPREMFFKGGKFLIIPAQMEIEQGILVPGHRFAPFCSSDIFPSEVKLTDGGGQVLSTRKVVLPIDEAAVFHALLGAGQMFEFFVADNQENAKVLSGGMNVPGKKLTLSVFDMGEFYRDHKFKHGDVLSVTVRDWTLGDFELTYVPAAARNHDGGMKWIEKLGDAMEEVIEEYSDYIEIPEQFARAFNIAGRDMLIDPQAGITEFYMRSRRIQIALVGGETVLTLVNDDQSEDADDDLYDEDIPGGVCISQGETGSFDKLLKDTGSVLQESEVMSFILDQFYQEDPTFEVFFQRAFGGQKLTFADEAQEVIFLNYLEDMWESLYSNYNRFVDENKGPVRSRLVEIIEERMNWLRYLGDLEVDMEKIAANEAFSNLVSASVHFTSLCQLLSSEEHFVSGSEVENMLETLDNMAELQKSYIDELNLVIAAMQ